MENILKNAEDKKFLQFSNAVKQNIINKLDNHPKTKEFKDEFSKIADMKAAFNKINTEFGSKED